MDDNGVLRDTTKPDYRKTAQELGFVSTDDEYELLLQDASRFKRPSQLRQLFAHVLVHCEIADEPKLFASLTHDDRGEDFARKLKRPSDSTEVKEKALEDLQDILARAGQTLENFNMPAPQGLGIPMDTNKELERETRYEREVERTKADARRLQMYPKQGEAFDEIARRVDAEEPGAFFIDGPGVVAKHFFARRSCTMSGVKDSLHWRALGAALPQFSWRVGELATRGLVYQYPCREKMSLLQSLLRAHVQMCGDRRD